MPMSASVPFRDLRRGAPRRAALPFLDDARIAGAGRRPLAFDQGDEQRVVVDPGGGVLAFGHDEAALDELAGGRDRTRGRRRRRCRPGSAKPGSAGRRAAGSRRRARPSSCPRPCPAHRRRSASATAACRRGKRPAATPATARACGWHRPSDWRPGRPSPRSGMAIWLGSLSSCSARWRRASNPGIAVSVASVAAFHCLTWASGLAPSISSSQR